MAILPRDKRDAMFEIYSFCRAVDDIADEGGDKRDQEGRRSRHGGARSRRFIPAATPASPRSRHALREFGFAREDFLAVIDGMEMESTPTSSRPTPRRSIFIATGSRAPWGAVGARLRHARGDGVALAHHLGRALQLTNILRDIDEDASHRPALFAARKSRRSRGHGSHARKSGGDGRSRRRLPAAAGAGAKTISKRPTPSWPGSRAKIFARRKS